MAEPMRDYITRLIQGGNSRKEILRFMSEERGENWTLNRLHWFMRSKGITMRARVDPVLVAGAVMEERQGLGNRFGCRYMALALNMDHGLRVGRNTVNEIMWAIDPNRGSVRRYPRERRLVYCPGTDYVWSIDGHDKLVMFGILIHGCVDQYSRKLFWLEADITNRDRMLVADYFLNAVETERRVPDYLYSDHGRENDIAGLAQACFYGEQVDAQAITHWFRTFSTSNVTIEAFWCQLRPLNVQYWRDVFNSLSNDHLWSGGNIDQWVVWYVYLPLIRNELQRTRTLYNGHTIRHQDGRIRPSGKPSKIYERPEDYGGVKRGKTVTVVQIDQIRALLGLQNFQRPNGIPDVIREVLDIKMNGRVVTKFIARDVYVELRGHLLELSHEANRNGNE